MFTFKYEVILCCKIVGFLKIYILVQCKKEKLFWIKVMMKLFEALSLTLAVSKTFSRRCFDCCDINI